MKTSNLLSKALKCAIDDISIAKDRVEANKIYLKWEFFHKNSAFKDAVKKKQEKFKNKFDK